MKRSIRKSGCRTVPENEVRSAVIRAADRRTGASGAIELACIPGLLDHYVTKLTSIWAMLGTDFTSEEAARLRELVARAIQAGYRVSPHARLVVEFQTRGYPERGITYRIATKSVTMVDIYNQWIAERTPPLFGKQPDAKVRALLGELGAPIDVPVLDVGAGTGRNALALARRGHPVTAIEVVPAFVAEMRTAASQDTLALEVIESDIHAAELSLESGRYKLAVMSEVVTHFRRVEELRSVCERVARALAPSGSLIFNAFLASSGYVPDEMERDAAHLAWSSVFTRGELEFLTKELPFDRVSDQPAFEYERDHLPADAWPPTGWFPAWSKWGNAADLPSNKTPVELRWLVYRRR